MVTSKNNRWILMLDGIEIFRASSIELIANNVGCSRFYIYKQTKEKSSFTYKKNVYQIIDRLA